MFPMLPTKYDATLEQTTVFTNGHNRHKSRPRDPSYSPTSPYSYRPNRGRGCGLHCINSIVLLRCFSDPLGWRSKTCCLPTRGDWSRGAVPPCIHVSVCDAHFCIFTVPPIGNCIDCFYIQKWCVWLVMCSFARLQ